MRRQLALDLPPPRSHGGKRDRAGRKPRRKGSFVEHSARPWHDGRHPVHVTLRVRRNTPNLRGFALAGVIGETLRRASTAPERATRRRTFRVIHFSIQPNHVHLIVEAASKTALARGMQGLGSILARRVNRQLRRRGALFADRYHARALASPAEVRRTIVYVLKNFEKHPVAVPDRACIPRAGIDPCSSARWFDGWLLRAPPLDSAEYVTPPVAEARTWLLRVGWKRHGLIHPDERPAGDDERPAGDDERPAGDDERPRAIE